MVEIKTTRFHLKKFCNKLGIDLVDGLGNKIQSSSWLINNKN